VTLFKEEEEEEEEKEEEKEEDDAGIKKRGYRCMDEGQGP
jgi:hypothetical protein